MVNEISEHVEQLFPALQTQRRDLHKYAESGWLEFRTSTLVADRLEKLGYALKLGKDVIDADSRMGLPSAAVLAEHEQRALEQGAIARWMPHFPAVSPALLPRWKPDVPAR